MRKNEHPKKSEACTETKEKLIIPRTLITLTDLGALVVISMFRLIKDALAEFAFFFRKIRSLSFLAVKTAGPSGDIKEKKNKQGSGDGGRGLAGNILIYGLTVGHAFIQCFHHPVYGISAVALVKGCGGKCVIILDNGADIGKAVGPSRDLLQDAPDRAEACGDFFEKRSADSQNNQGDDTGSELKQIFRQKQDRFDKKGS